MCRNGWIDMTKRKTTRLAVIVGMNIAMRRKNMGWTQAHMAELYNYIRFIVTIRAGLYFS